MKNQKLNSIGLLAIFLVIAIPTVYGAVEPSIIINMESGQTEKPIQVKNSGGSTVFSVDVDGTIFPDVAPAPIEFGTEIVVLDQSAKDGQSQTTQSLGTYPFGYSFELPTTANLWKVTAIEFKTGNTIKSGHCVALFANGGVDGINSHLDHPLNAGEQYGTIRIGWTHIPTVATNTIAKVPLGTQLVSGGQTVVAIAGDCNPTTGSEFAGSSSTTETWGEGCGNLSDSDTLGMGSLSSCTPSDVGFEYYMKVYAIPLG